MREYHTYDDLTARLRVGVALLPEPQRELILKMYGFEGRPCSLEDAAYELHVRRQTAESDHTAALAALQTYLT